MKITLRLIVSADTGWLPRWVLFDLAGYWLEAFGTLRDAVQWVEKHHPTSQLDMSYVAGHVLPEQWAAGQTPRSM